MSYKWYKKVFLLWDIENIPIPRKMKIEHLIDNIKSKCLSYSPKASIRYYVYFRPFLNEINTDKQLALMKHRFKMRINNSKKKQACDREIINDIHQIIDTNLNDDKTLILLLSNDNGYMKTLRNTRFNEVDIIQLIYDPKLKL